MIYGLSFDISQDELMVLKKVFDKILLKYYWFIPQDQNEVWFDDNDYIFSEKYTGVNLYSLSENKFKILFLKLQAYKNEPNKYCNIESFDEYLSSSCELMALIYDCEYMEVYSKDSEVTLTIEKNVDKLHCSNIQIITDENIQRNRMNIL